MCSNNATLHFCKCFDNFTKGSTSPLLYQSLTTTSDKKGRTGTSRQVWDEKIEVQKWQGPSESGRPASSSTGGLSFQDAIPPVMTNSWSQRAKTQASATDAHTALPTRTQQCREDGISHLQAALRVSNTFLHMASPSLTVTHPTEEKTKALVFDQGPRGW